MSGDEHTAHRFDRGRGEGDSAEVKLLDDLRGVTVARGRIGADLATPVRVVGRVARLRAARRGADLGLHDERDRGVEQPGAGERREAEDRRGRETTPGSDQRRRRDLGTVHLGEAVHRRAEQIR